jgi:riboflavin kinase / FMN adenylyltransferase
MQVFHAISEAGSLAASAVCLGNFDGVHLGHQALFAQAKRLGRAVALTFQPHPGKVLSPQLAPQLITLLPRKLELMEHYGLEAVIVQPFDRAYASTPSELFERALLDEASARHLVVGGDFTYGARRAGTVETLERAARGRGAQLFRVLPVEVEGVVASSSRVREYLLEGRVDAAHRLLGRYFDLDGRVVPGKGRGRAIGYPTANVDSPNELRPAAGVYAVRTRLGDEREWRPGAANIGVKPTFGGTNVTIEVHLLDFAGDLYGRAVRVQFLARLRAEQRFSSVEELVAQIGRDVVAARAAIARASTQDF